MFIVYDCKGDIRGFAKTKKVISKPLYKISMDSFSSSVNSIEGYFHSLVFVDAATGHRWIYGLRYDSVPGHVW
jgi:hypothetical protein